MTATLRRLVAVLASVVAGAALATAPAGASARPAKAAIVSLALGRTSLGAGGGAATIRLVVRHGATCWFTAPKQVRVDRARRGCRAGRDATVVRLGAADSTKASRYALTAWVRGRSGGAVHRRIVLTQAGAKPIGTTLASATKLVVAEPYSNRLVATGGRGPYRFSVTGGSLPPGIALSATGEITGTPTTVGQYDATVSITDASRPTPLTVSVSLKLPVLAPPVSITTGSLAGGTLGTAYSATLSATGGTAPYTWTVTAGSLPAGLTLATSGLLSGTPTSAGTSTFTVTAADASSPSQSTTRQLTLVVTSAPLEITSFLPQIASLGAAYSYTLTATGGAAPYTWEVTSGSLPPGLTLSSNGVISGTPTATGSYSVVVEALDSAQPQGAASATLTFGVVGSLLSITAPSTLPTAIAGTVYSYTFTATGGTLPYTWEVLGSGLPSWATLSSTGVLSGTPPAGTSSTSLFTVQATDASSPTKIAQETVTLTVG